MTSKTSLLIFVVFKLATLGSGAVLNSIGNNNEVAVERENINSIENNSELYPENQARAALVDQELNNVAPQNWTCPISETDGPSDVWYRYLNSLYCEFSKYDKQVAKKSNDVANMDIYQRNFQSFLDKTKKYNIAEQDTISKMDFSELRFNELNHILKLTIKDEMHISCAEPYMSVKGNYIVFSHLNAALSARTVDRICLDLLNSNKLKYMNIFALNTVFIDDDLKKRMNVIVIAPKWTIVNSRRIELDGEDGKSQDTTAPTTNGHFLRAADGKPGNPGGPGGNFFGIGEEFTGGANLVISVNGGRGSAGQNGGNGKAGNDGTPPLVPTDIACAEDVCDNGKINTYECDKINCEIETVADYNWAQVILYCSYRMYGEQGLPGTSAGNGGKGGQGGDPGDIVLFELNGHAGVTQIKNPGSNGLDGKGGSGGVGGRRGDEIVVKCNDVFKYKWKKEETHFSYERARSGENGITGGNTKNMEVPKKATNLSNLDKAKTINQYKTFLRDNINDPFTSFFLMNFLNRLDNNPNIKSVYDTFGFVDELKSLEVQFHKLKRYVNYLPFYASLLDRVTEYAQKVESDKDREVLGYLYTAALGRKHNLEDDFESNLITDITSYLENLEKDIKDLRDLRNLNIKEDITNKYKEKYKAEIDKKINDANELISKEIKPEIENIETDIDKQIGDWIDEIMRLKNQAKIDIEALNKKQRELQNAMALQGVLGGLKVLGLVVSFMGPVGTVAGSVIEIGSSVAETLILPNGTDNIVPNFKQSVTDLNALKDQIKKLSTSGLEKKLETVSEGVGQDFPNISLKVSEIRRSLATLDRNKLNFAEVSELEVELTTTLQKKKDDLKDKESKGDSSDHTKNAITVIENLQKLTKLTSAAVDTFNKYKKIQGKVDEINKAIQKNEDNFDRLKKYEGEIYNTIAPMLEKMGKDLDDVVSKAGSKSKVALDVTKWKVKSSLKDLMLQMQQLAKSFSVEGGLVRAIEKLQEAMVALISVQDYIQDYQKDQNLANFIAGISSISFTGNDDDHERARRDLEITVRSGIVMQRHKVAIDAFRQFVFPFAHMYFKDLILPSQFDPGNTELDNAVIGFMRQIEHIKSKLADYKASVTEFDQCYGTGEFKSTGRFSKPFFTWQKEENGNMISKLLSGEEVIVKANVTESPYDAIKFNYVEFGFRSKDKTVQSKINQVLRGFKLYATHLGDSYYSYGDKTYLMTTADITVWYSFEKKRGGEEPYHTSKSYDKIKKGDFMLSPYASWKVKLENKPGQSSFKDLEVFKGAVRFVLEGNGHYIIRGHSDCSDPMVDKYYKAVDERNPVPEVNAHYLLPYMIRGRSGSQ